MKLSATVIHHGTLTHAEEKVLELLCCGLLRKQIADRLHRSYSCISHHVEAIAQKLDAHSTAEIVAKAVANKLVEITFKSILLLSVFIADSSMIDMRRPPTNPRPPLSRSQNKHNTPSFQRES